MLTTDIYLPGPAGSPALNTPGEHYTTFVDLLKARPEISCEHPNCIGYHVMPETEYLKLTEGSNESSN